MLGFTGHAVASPELDPFGSQYLLPDGSYSSLCQPGDEKGGAPHGGGHHCDICTIEAGHLFALPGAGPVATPVFMRGGTSPVTAIAGLRRILSHHRRSRGPPFLA
jgi:hypothetical protein